MTGGKVLPFSRADTLTCQTCGATEREGCYCALAAPSPAVAEVPFALEREAARPRGVQPALFKEGGDDGDEPR